MEEERPRVYVEITEDGRIAVSWMGLRHGEYEALNILGAAAEAVRKKMSDRSIVTPVRKPPFHLVER